MRLTGILATFLAILCAAIGYAADTLDVYFINVGAGDAILIDCGDWEALLDAGPGTKESNQALMSALARYVQDDILELAILSHAHLDHYGGFVTVFDQYSVWEFWSSYDEAPDSCGPKYVAFSDALASTGLLPQMLTQGDRAQFGNLNWVVLGPQVLKLTPKNKNDNENSLVLLLTYGEIHFLFTGDIGSHGETALADIELPKSRIILKVAHHGSDTSTSTEFLEWSTPDLAVVSTKCEAPPALSNLELNGIPYAMTSEFGTTIRVSTDGAGWEASNLTGNALDVTVATSVTLPSDLFLNVEPIVATGQGNDATLIASTVPAAICSITVYYNSGPSSAAGLAERTANVEGQVSWTWRVGTRTAPGKYRIDVSATLGGEVVAESVWFEVLDTGSPG